MFYLKIHAANIEASKFFVFVFVGDQKLFLKISQMKVVCICYCYNFHIFLRESSQKYNSDPQTCGLARFNDGPGSAVMKEEDL